MTFPAHTDTTHRRLGNKIRSKKKGVDALHAFRTWAMLQWDRQTTKNPGGGNVGLVGLGMEYYRTLT